MHGPTVNPHLADVRSLGEANDLFEQPLIIVKLGVAANDTVAVVEVDRHRIESSARLEDAERKAEGFSTAGGGKPERGRGVDRCVGGRRAQHSEVRHERRRDAGGSS